MTSIQERVAKGAAWLDDASPGWRDAIAPNELRMHSACHCVLGQVFALAATRPDGIPIAGYDYAVARFGNWIDDELWEVDHGFTLYLEEMKHGDTTPLWDALEAEWRRVIHSSRVPAETQEPSHVH